MKAEVVLDLVVGGSDCDGKHLLLFSVFSFFFWGAILGTGMCSAVLGPELGSAVLGGAKARLKVTRSLSGS